MTIRESIQTQIAESMRSKEAQTRRFTWNGPPSNKKKLRGLEKYWMQIYFRLYTRNQKRGMTLNRFVL
jgi:hypothetical protein